MNLRDDGIVLDSLTPLVSKTILIRVMSLDFNYKSKILGELESITCFQPPSTTYCTHRSTGRLTRTKKILSFYSFSFDSNIKIKGIHLCLTRFGLNTKTNISNSIFRSTFSSGYSPSRIRNDWSLIWFVKNSREIQKP